MLYYNMIKKYLKDNKLSYLHVFAVIIPIIGFVIHLLLSLRTPYVNGVDGSFYALNLKELITYGWFTKFNLIKTPATSPIFFFVAAPFALIFGSSAAVKITTTLFSVLIGVMVYKITKLITKSTKAALIAETLAILSPISMRMAADNRKSVVGLFFLTLAIYLTLKYTKGKKNILYILIACVLGILSHKSFILFWIILLGYFVLLFVFKRKLYLKQNWIFLAGNAAITLVVLITYGSIGKEIGNNIAQSSDGIINMAGIHQSDLHSLPLIVFSIPAILHIVKYSTKQNLLILAWLIVNYLLMFPQVRDEGFWYWRMIMMLYPCLCVLCGYTYYWLYKHLREVAYILMSVPIALSIVWMVNFGLNDFQMKPLGSRVLLDSLEIASKDVEKEDVVITNLGDNHWIRYFFTKYTYEFNVQLLLEDISKGKVDLDKSDVWIVLNSFEEENWLHGMDEEIKPENTKLEISNTCDDLDNINTTQEPMLSELLDTLEVETTRCILKNSYISVYKLSDINFSSENMPTNDASEPPPDQEPIETETIKSRKYAFSRMKYVSSYILLPYELILMLEPPFVSLLEIQLGIPLSIGMIGLLLLVTKDVAKSIGRIGFAEVIGVTFVIVIFWCYLLVSYPEWFWGPTESEEEFFNKMQEQLGFQEAFEDENNELEPDFEDEADTGQSSTIPPEIPALQSTYIENVEMVNTSHWVIHLSEFDSTQFDTYKMRLLDEGWNILEESQEEDEMEFLFAEKENFNLHFEINRLDQRGIIDIVSNI